MRLLLILSIILITSCHKATQSVEKAILYNGPMMVAENIETIYSDSAYTKLKLQAPVQYVLQNNNREFPQGIYVEFFDKGVDPKAILTSNYAIFYKDQNLYKVSGKVVVDNKRDGKKLSTEELFWSPETNKIYTDKHVIIQTPNETVHGDGLDAKQDFSSYSIRNPIGTVLVK
jgi:LPS export ABC transporter protein LptC